MLSEAVQKMCATAVAKFGKDAQLVILIEECSGLCKEACKSLRGSERTEKMTEELVDVLVMCEQIRQMLMVSDEEINRMAEEKMRRTMKRAGVKNG